MLIKIPRGWEIPEREATPEAVYLNRRTLMKGLAAGPILAAAPGLVSLARAAEEGADPSAHLYPVERNPKFTLEREITPADISTTYNNFYEYGSHKNIWMRAQDLPIRPWEVRIDGLVEEEKTVAIDDLLAAMPLEERLYRHRCVEAWSMAVPWSGFPMTALLDYAKPMASAKYIEMQTFDDSIEAPGFKQFWYPWPYIEGVTMAEAKNDLTFLVTGMYGKPVPKQNGAPLRLALPWKYGFKSVKSIVRFTFTERRPETFWETVAGNEYGFWANVNPEVSHPRWSQAQETDIGTGEKIPTVIYNGYGEYVAELYAGMEGEKLFM